MAIISRVSQLLRADVHAVLDRIEEPQQLLKQALRDMREELASAEQRAAAIAAQLETSVKRKSELEAKRAEINEELDLCFQKQESDLARSLVRRKLEAERLISRLASRIEDGEADLRQAKSELTDRANTLEGLRQKAAVFAEPATDPGPQDEVAFLLRELSISDDEVEVAFLREQERRSAS